MIHMANKIAIGQSSIFIWMNEKGYIKAILIDIRLMY